MKAAQEKRLEKLRAAEDRGSITHACGQASYSGNQAQDQEDLQRSLKSQFIVNAKAECH